MYLNSFLEHLVKTSILNHHHRISKRYETFPRTIFNSESNMIIAGYTLEKLQSPNWKLLRY